MTLLVTDELKRRMDGFTSTRTHIAYDSGVPDKAIRLRGMQHAFRKNYLSLAASRAITVGDRGRSFEVPPPTVIISFLCSVNQVVCRNGSSEGGQRLRSPAGAQPALA